MTLRVVEFQRMIGRTLDANDITRGDAHAFDKGFQQRAARRGFKILDHMRLNARIADQPERIARGAALGIVVNDHVNGMLGCGRHQSAFAEPMLYDRVFDESPRPW